MLLLLLLLLVAGIALSLPAVQTRIAKELMTKINTSYGTSIEIEEQYLNMIVHFPLLSDFNAKQRKQLCEQFQKHSKVLTRDLIEKFAEIVPYKASYDKNMFKITMQDGNIVYTNLNSIKMLSKYQSVLTKLKGQSVC